MKVTSVSVAVAMAMVVMMIGSELQGAEAQTVSCLNANGGFAPFGDANAVVQQLRVMPGSCCHTGSGFCTVVATSGNAAATVCGPSCPTCIDLGNDLNQVLAQCNVNNQIEGVFSPDGGTQLYYLTSNSNHPN